MLKINTKEFEKAIKELEAVKQKLRKCDIDLGILIQVNNNNLTITSTDTINFLTAIIKDFECDEDNFKARITGLKDFKQSFKHFKNEYTYIEIKDDTTIIKNDNKTIKMKYNDTSIFTTKKPLSKSYTCNISGNELLTRIRQVESFRDKRGDYRPYLKGIALKGYDTIASDGFRMAWSKGDTFFKGEIIINDACIKALKKLIKKKDEISVTYDDKQIVFKFNNLELQCELLEGNILDYEKLFEVESNTIVNINKKELEDGVKFLNIYAKKNENNVVRWKITRGKLTLVVKNNDEIIDTKINIKSIGDDLEIAFNNKFILDALKLIKLNEITLNFSTSMSPLIIESNNVKYFILPIKLRED